jgi:hypothetical protein
MQWINDDTRLQSNAQADFVLLYGGVLIQFLRRFGKDGRVAAASELLRFKGIYQ